MGSEERIDLKDKIVLISGATQGIGLAAARELAKTGCVQVIMVRNEARAKEVVAELNQISGHAKNDYITVDFASLRSIRAAAEKFHQKYDRLHVLINNAGGIFMEPEVTADGLERTFGVNHMGYFELTRLMLDKLKATGNSRIVVVSSGAHFRALSLNLDTVAHPKSHAGMNIYCQSKLCNLLFTYELAKRLEGSSVTVNAVHPGLIRSGFGHNNGGWLGFGVRWFGWIMRSPEQGARGTVFLATAKALEGKSGLYFHSTRRMPSSPLSKRQDLQRGLWELSEKISANIH